MVEAISLLLIAVDFFGLVQNGMFYRFLRTDQSSLLIKRATKSMYLILQLVEGLAQNRQF